MQSGINIRVTLQSGQFLDHDNVQPPDRNNKNGELEVFDIHGDHIRTYGNSYCFWENRARINPIKKTGHHYKFPELDDCQRLSEMR